MFSILVYQLEHVEVSFYLSYKCGFYSPITLIQSGQTNKQTNTQQLSFNNIDIVLGWFILNEIFFNCKLRTPPQKVRLYTNEKQSNLEILRNPKA